MQTEFTVTEVYKVTAQTIRDVRIAVVTNNYSDVVVDTDDRKIIIEPNM